jgi:hypothetical protein
MNSKTAVKKNKGICYPVARNTEGKIVTTTSAIKGNYYACVLCGKKMCFKSSDRKLRQPHFAHLALSPNCTPESALHHAFKETLHERINDAIQKKCPLLISYACPMCLHEHKSNLIRSAVEVKMEYDMGVCRPDLALINSDGRVYAVIEVIVNHWPEENVEKHYEDEGIFIVRFDLEWARGKDQRNVISKTDEELLMAAHAEVLDPLAVDFHSKIKCTKCRNEL